MSGRSLGRGICTGSVLLLTPLVSGQQTQTGVRNVPVHLEVEAGTPLRLYITKRASFRLGDPVQARLAEPAWSFDRIVIPAGAVVKGEVTELDPEPKLLRAMAMIRGDFTPLKTAKISFTKVILPSGKSLELDAEPSTGLDSIYDPAQAAKNKKSKRATTRDPNSRSSKLFAFAKQQAEGQANTRTRGMIGLVRGPNRREWLESLLWSKLPYHPQWYRSGTRFDAVLEKPIDFGMASVPATSLEEIGTQPALNSPATVRFLTTVNSENSEIGEPVTGELSQPLFSAGHQLILPQGTLLTGKVTMVRRARMFHRGGQLRFAFDNVQVPSVAGAEVARNERARAELTAAEESHGALKVDSEGTAKAAESKTRFLRPVIAGLIAAKSMDNDAGKQTASSTTNGNPVGSSLGGFSGFGLFGTVVSRVAPAEVGSAFGFYGLGWSVFSTVISRGKEVAFPKNAAIAIRFGAPTGRR